MPLPSLTHDFRHARIDDVVIGPRREVTLAIAPLDWHGSTARFGDVVQLRFGGVENLAEVSTFFAVSPHKQSELAWLGYAKEQRSKPGRLFFELAFERIDPRLVIQCSSLQARGPGDAAHS